MDRQQLQQGAPSTTNGSQAAELRKNPDLYSMLDGNTSTSTSKRGATPSTSGSRPQDTPSLVTLQLGLNTSSTTTTLDSSSATGVVLPNGVVLHHRPEVLAPVGGWPQLHAAVENGADAVYFGLSDFNARAR
jgi:hypothetical protein